MLFKIDNKIVMKNITYDNISQLIIVKFPELLKFGELDKDDLNSPYAVLHFFDSFLVKEINKDSGRVQEIFDFINIAYNNFGISKSSSSDDTLQNLLYIEIFEQLAQTKEAIKNARKYLTGQAKDEFETIFRYAGIEKYNPSEKNESIVSKWRRIHR